MIRHLLYHCCALLSSQEWELNLHELSQYARVFNGRKIVVLACGENIAAPTEVEGLLRSCIGEDVHVVRRANDPHLREVAYFDEHIEMMRPRSANECFFFAHTKGASRHNKFELLAVRAWRRTMYEKCLSNADAVNKWMARYATAGCFRHAGPIAPLPNNALWHFSGTFWWMNSNRLFSRPGGYAPELHRYGAEGYPGKMFPVTDSLNIYGEPGNHYTMELPYVCRNCGNTFTKNNRGHQKKVCPNCFKRAAVIDMERVDAEVTRAL